MPTIKNADSTQPSFVVRLPDDDGQPTYTDHYTLPFVTPWVADPSTNTCSKPGATSGNCVWARKLGGGYNDEALAVACDDSGSVSIGDVLTLVNIALGALDGAECPSGLASGPPVTVTFGSVTVTLVSVTLPVLVTVNVYVILSPAFWRPSPLVSA